MRVYESAYAGTLATQACMLAILARTRLHIHSIRGVHEAAICTPVSDEPGVVTEETAGAGASVPRAIIFAVVSTAVLGLLELVSILFSIQVRCSRLLLLSNTCHACQSLGTVYCSTYCWILLTSQAACALHQALC